MQLTCPKCQGDMRQYERSGVTVDQCSECRGIFLDRGELEKLFEAEANWTRQQTVPPAGQSGGYVPPPPPAAPPAQPGYVAPAHVPPPAPLAPGYPSAYGHGHYGYHGHYRHKRHRGFLSEFFD